MSPLLNLECATISAGSADFPGRQMHSHNYREAGPFAGQRVVVVGAAASGEDIGREIADTAKEVPSCPQESPASLSTQKSAPHADQRVAMPDATASGS